ncbi:HalOD1 output domain-containing protein [Halorussus caseinilyticus]|uniref:HalOD1 output domain-containing protein n=1 Tax=Halorussus caseinilyticus TaxID=3034025 RepID=A0ABD5WJ99_9EURY|nr:HalOD1 output domain-containing protein [Halorussus sp. DT72]
MSGDTFEKRSTSQRVITAVAEATDSDPTEVGPLYHVIDPDALDRLFSPTRGSGRNGGHVEFTFGGCDVVVSGNGDVEVTERGVAAELADENDSAHRLGTDLDETA